MNTQALKFLTNANATSAWLPWRGGSGTFLVEAAWGGGSVTLQIKGPNGAPIDVGAGTSFTANGCANFELPPCELRAGVLTATSVHAVAVSHQ
jgi:hypothetical protein